MVHTRPAASNGPWWAASWSPCSWNTPGSRNSRPGSTWSSGTTRPTPTWPSPWGRSCPRVQVMRGERRKGTRYFGPYTAGAIRETMDTLLRVFPVRSCSAGRAQTRPGQRPALPARLHRQVLGALRRAGSRRRTTAPWPRTSAPSWAARPSGSSPGWKRRWPPPSPNWTTNAPPGCATTSSRCGRSSNATPWCSPRTPTPTSSPLHEDELEAAVQVFHVRGGRIRGQRGWVVEKVEDSTTPDLVEHLLQQVYGEDGEQPGPAAPRGPGARRAQQRRRAGANGSAACAGPGWTSGCRSAGTRPPCMSTVRENAEHALKLHKSRRAGDLTIALAGPAGTAGSPGAARAAAADRVLRHLPRPGHQRGRPPWWWWRTACRRSPTTASSPSPAPRRRTTPRPCMTS